MVGPEVLYLSSGSQGLPSTVRKDPSLGLASSKLFLPSHAAFCSRKIRLRYAFFSQPMGIADAEREGSDQREVSSPSPRDDERHKKLFRYPHVDRVGFRSHENP